MNATNWALDEYCPLLLLDEAEDEYSGSESPSIVVVVIAATDHRESPQNAPNPIVKYNCMQNIRLECLNLSILSKN